MYDMSLNLPSIPYVTHNTFIGGLNVNVCRQNDQKEWTLQSEQTLKYRGTDIRKLNGRYKVSKHLNIEVPTHANYSQK